MEGRRSSAPSSIAGSTRDRRQQTQVREVSRATSQGLQPFVPQSSQPQPIAPYDPHVYQKVVALLSSTANGCITEIGYREVCAKLNRQEILYNELVDAHKKLQASTEHCKSDNARLTELIMNHESCQRTDRERNQSDTQLIQALKEKITRQEQELEILKGQFAMLQETQNMGSSDAYRLLEMKYQYVLDLLQRRQSPELLQNQTNRRENLDFNNQVSNKVVTTKTEHHDVGYESADPILQEVRRDLYVSSLFFSTIGDSTTSEHSLTDADIGPPTPKQVNLAVHTKSVQESAGGQALSNDPPLVDAMNVTVPQRTSSIPTSVATGSRVSSLNPGNLPSPSHHAPTEGSFVGSGAATISASQSISEGQSRPASRTATQISAVVSPVPALEQVKPEISRRSPSLSTPLDPTPVPVSASVVSQMLTETGFQHRPSMPGLPASSPTPTQMGLQSTPQHASVTPPTLSTQRNEKESSTTVLSTLTSTPTAISTPHPHGYDTLQSEIPKPTSPSVLPTPASKFVVSTNSATTQSGQEPQHMDVDGELASAVIESHEVGIVVGEGAADAEDDGEDDEDWSDLTDDESEQKRPVVDCISSIFYDDDNDERFCRLCNTRIKTLNLPDPRPIFSESSMRDLISHGKNEHPVAWTKLRNLDGGPA